MYRNLRLVVVCPIATAFLALALAQAPASQAPRLTTSEVDACFSALADFKLGKELTPLRKLSAYVESLEADSPEARELEMRLVAVLGSKVSLEAKDFASRQLALIGGDASLAALEKLLGEPAARQTALYALERIPASGAVLRQSLAGSRGTDRVQVISALGRRRDPEAVPLLRPLTADTDAGVSEAAIRALGMIGTPDSAAALAQARKSARGGGRYLAGLSLLGCAEQLASAGKSQEAARIFRELNKPGDDVALRFGSLRGLGLLVKDSSVIPDLIAFIRQEQPKLAANAIHVLLEMPGLSPIQALADALPGLKPASTQQAAILALSDRQDAKAAALPAIVQASGKGSPEVRVAAWTAVGRLGDSSHIALLVKALAAVAPAERTAARLALTSMNCPDFDSVLRGLLEKADADTRLELVGVVEERRMISAADWLMASVKQGDDRRLRGAALKALRRTGSESQIRPLVDLLASSSDAVDSPALEETVSSLLRQFPRPHVAYLLDSYRANTDTSRRVGLVAGLRGVGDPDALALLKEAARTPGQPDIQHAAILSLSDWPDPAPIPDLLVVAAQTSLDASIRTLALRGSLRLVGLPGDRPHGESVSVLRRVVELAPEAAEKKGALAMLERFPSPEAVALGQAALADPAMSAEAKTALEHLRAVAAGDARLLVYTRNYSSSGEVYVHDNIASSVAAIRELGRENGFTIDATDQPSVFTDEKLVQYKAIVFSNSNGEAFENDEQRSAFQRYIRRGGGFVGIHAACASEANWPWFWSLIGGTFDFHPPFQAFTIRVVDKEHPSTAFFQDDSWRWEDEFYILKERNDKVRVLLAGDLKSLKTPGDQPERLANQPDPCPLAWCQQFEGARVWYTALGHKKEHYEDPVYQKHLLGGILWVIGEK